MLGGFYSWGAGTGVLHRVYRASWLWLLWMFGFTTLNYIYIFFLISMLHLYWSFLPRHPSEPHSYARTTGTPQILQQAVFGKDGPHCASSFCAIHHSSLQDPCPNGACHDPGLEFSPVLLLQIARLCWTNLATMGAACVLDSGFFQIRVIQLKVWAFN